MTTKDKIKISRNRRLTKNLGKFRQDEIQLNANNTAEIDQIFLEAIKSKYPECYLPLRDWLKNESREFPPWKIRYSKGVEIDFLARRIVLPYEFELIGKSKKGFQMVWKILKGIEQFTTVCTKDDQEEIKTLL